MKDVSKETMVQLVTFIYTGEVSVPPETMTEFLKTAEALKIKGLAGGYSHSQLLKSVREQPVQAKSSKGVQFQSSQINRNRAEHSSESQSTIDTPTTSHQQVKQEQHDDEQFSDGISLSSERSNAYGMDNDSIDSIDRHNDDNAGDDDENQTTNTESNEPMAKRAKPNEGISSHGSLYQSIMVLIYFILCFQKFVKRLTMWLRTFRKVKRALNICIMAVTNSFPIKFQVNQQNNVGIA